VRVSARGLTPITFGQSDQMKVGDVVLAIGDPFSVGQTVTMGIVSAVGASSGRRTRSAASSRRMPRSIRATRAARWWTSRQPDRHQHADLLALGRLPGIGFAIPVSLAKRVLEQIIETGSVTRGWFGVDVADISSDLAESLGLKGTAGRSSARSSAAAPPRRRPSPRGHHHDDQRPHGSDTSTALNAIAECRPGNPCR
jgi:serine protease DegQ